MALSSAGMRSVACMQPLRACRLYVAKAHADKHTTYLSISEPLLHTEQVLVTFKWIRSVGAIRHNHCRCIQTGGIRLDVAKGKLQIGNAAWCGPYLILGMKIVCCDVLEVSERGGKSANEKSDFASCSDNNGKNVFGKKNISQNGYEYTTRHIVRVCNISKKKKGGYYLANPSLRKNCDHHGIVTVSPNHYYKKINN